MTSAASPARAGGAHGGYLSVSTGCEVERPTQAPIRTTPHQPGIPLPKKPNYDFEKRKKEEERKKKKDAKREDRLQRNRDNAAENRDGESPEIEGGERDAGGATP